MEECSTVKSQNQVLGYATHFPGTHLTPYIFSSSSSLKPQQVEIQILFCGICYSDIHTMNNDWGTTRYPHIPGHEIIGKIIKTGTHVTDLHIGQIVGVGWQSYCCLRCEFCLRNQETVCKEKKKTCLDSYGGFSEKICVDSHFAYPLPTSLNPTTAAPLFCAGITTYTPFILHQVKPFARVAIFGIGGLGHLALQFAKAFGYQVTAISHSKDKKEDALRFGAHDFICTDGKECRNDLKDRFDFLLITPHIDLNWAELISWLRPEGKLCFVGIPQKEICFPVRSLISGNRTVCGSSTGNRQLMQDMLEFAAFHHIVPQVEFFSLNQVNQAIEHLMSNQVRYRIVLYQDEKL